MATFKTSFHKYLIHKFKDTILVYLHGDKIYSALKNNNSVVTPYSTTYSAPNNRWMNEHNHKINKDFNSYEHLKHTLFFRLFAYLPDEDKEMTHSAMPPVKFRTVKDRIYFEVQLYEKWYKIAVIQDHPLKHCPEKWTIKFYNTNNSYTQIGVNYCDSTDKVIDEFLNNIHIEFFPSKLKAWMEARTLAKSMVATLTNENEERSYGPSNGMSIGVYSVNARTGKNTYIGNTTSVKPVKPTKI